MAHAKTPLIGAHVSISGGYHLAIERGVTMGCTAIQIFTKSNRQWKAKKITEQEALLFQQALKNSPIQSVIAHASYLINIASPHQEVFTKSKAALEEEITRCATLGIQTLVLHPGAYLTADLAQTELQVINTLNEVIAATDNTVCIALENMAGQGSSLCADFNQIARILSGITTKQRIGVCLDTCHAFAAGYRFTSPKEYLSLWKEIETSVGIDAIKAIHMNDSKKECGSHVDRHEHIGKGLIGLKAFEQLVNDKALIHIPKVVETPQETETAMQKDVELLQSLVR